MNYATPEQRDLAVVRRWAILPTIRQQSVAEHSFYVALYTQEICNRIGWKCPDYMLLYALMHDMEEIRTGDIPPPAKKQHNIAPTLEFIGNICLAPEQLLIIKVADLLEAYIFVYNEIKMGNSLMRPNIKELYDKLMAIEDATLKAVAKEIMSEHAMYKGRVR